MKRNVGKTESVVRVGVGLAALLAASRVRSKVGAALLGALGGSSIESGLGRYCLMNQWLGIDNAKEPEPPRKPLNEGTSAWFQEVVVG